ncbi:MAG: SCO family protein [Methylococcales bacterium]
MRLSRTIGVATAILVPISVSAASQAANDHQQAARYSRSVVSYEIPDVMMVEPSGTEISLRLLLSYEGTVLLQFIFTTCPTICPVMSQVFSSAQEKFGPDLDRIRMVSISIDPEQDTPARLRDYARRFKARPQWVFLTGSLDDILAVEKAFDVYRGNKMRHEPITFLRASPEEWVRINGLMNATELVAEYRRLIAR